MTVIRPNSVAGINSITVQSGNSLSVHKSNGELIRTLTSSSGVSTFSSVSVGTATTDNSAAKSINIGLGASISQHDANTLSFGTNGDERLKIESNGDVTLTNTSSNPQLAIISAANGIGEIQFGDTADSVRGNIIYRSGSAGDALCFNGYNNTERLRIDSSGRVLIGHDSSLAIGGGDNAPLQTSATSSVVFGGVRYTNASGGPFLSLSKSRAAAAGSNTIVQDDDELGTILFSGDDGTDLISKGAQISAAVDGTPGSNDMPGRLVFSTTADGAASPTERLRIDSSGRVVIGGSSTYIGGAALAVLGTGNTPNTYGSFAIAKVGSNPTSGTTLTNIRLNGGSLGTGRGAEINSAADANWSDSSSHPTRLTFHTVASSSTSATERLRIASDGNVHINTTDNGTANAKLNIEDSSSVGVNVLKLINKPSSSNGKARLELYAETSGGQGATAYIQSTSGTDADGSNSANDAGLEFHTSQGGSGTDVTALKIDNSGKTRISTHEGNDALHITPLASASTSIIINTWPDNANGRNWAIRNRYNAHGRLEFMRGTNNSDSPLHTTMSLEGANVTVAGALSKGSGSFKIDHPLPSKTNTHHLVHSFIEGPQADLIYRGKVDLVGGTSTVNIDTVAGMSDGTFVLLNREVQCFTSNETGWTAVKGSVSGNVLTITAQDNSCTDTISWMVVGERKDPHMYDTEWTDADGKVILEPLKETEVSLGGG